MSVVAPHPACVGGPAMHNMLLVLGLLREDGRGGKECVCISMRTLSSDLLSAETVFLRLCTNKQINTPS